MLSAMRSFFAGKGHEAVAVADTQERLKNLMIDVSTPQDQDDYEMKSWEQEDSKLDMQEARFEYLKRKIPEEEMKHGSSVTEKNEKIRYLELREKFETICHLKTNGRLDSNIIENTDFEAFWKHVDTLNSGEKVEKGQRLDRAYDALQKRGYIEPSRLTDKDFEKYRQLTNECTATRKKAPEFKNKQEWATWLGTQKEVIKSGGYYVVGFKKGGGWTSRHHVSHAIAIRPQGKEQIKTRVQTSWTKQSKSAGIEM